MSRDLASILKINKLTEIPNYDKIELATVENWEVIVQKGQFKVNDLCVYIEYDTILPVKPEFEFLRSRCYNKLYDGFRIRNMKMAGVYSQGIVFPLSILPENVISVKDSLEGFNVANILNIKRYAPEDLEEKQITTNKLHKFFMKYKCYRRFIGKYFQYKKGYPEKIKESDEKNAQKVFDYLIVKKPDEIYYETEKLEGQAATFSMQSKRFLGFKIKNYSIYSHTTKRKVGDNSNWDKISKLYNIKEILKRFKENYTIQGEIIGEGIQKNIYNIEGLDFYVYKVINSNTGIALNFKELKTFCEKVNLKIVPVLNENVKLTNFANAKEAVDYSNGQSILYSGLREGVVWRSVNDQELSFKIKSPEYDIKFNGDKRK